ncbi:YkoP family protein [Cerasibacillus sp. JNUCC 74]
MLIKSCLLSFWTRIDPIYFACSRLTYIVDPNQNRTVLRARLTKYKGATVVLSDGTVLQKNDILLKIHLHNVKLLKELSTVTNDIKRAVFIYHIIKQAMPSLAMYIQSHPSSEKVKGVIGITNLSRGAERLGFEKAPLKNALYRFFKQVTLLPINSFTGTKKINPVYLFMSKRKLLTIYAREESIKL